MLVNAMRPGALIAVKAQFHTFGRFGMTMQRHALVVVDVILPARHGFCVFDESS